mgnify:CR=1 FL=1
MTRELMELSLMILSGETPEKILEEFAKFKQKNSVYFPSMQVTTTIFNGEVKHFYHLLVQYKPKGG